MTESKRQRLIKDVDSAAKNVIAAKEALASCQKTYDVAIKTLARNLFSPLLGGEEIRLALQRLHQDKDAEKAIAFLAGFEGLTDQQLLTLVRLGRESKFGPLWKYVKDTFDSPFTDTIAQGIYDLFRSYQ